MSNASRILYLRIALIVTGLAFIFGIDPLTIVWLSGWAWGQGHSHDLTMIIGVYATSAYFCSSRPKFHSHTRASSGSRSAQARYMPGLWLFSPYRMCPNEVI
jgi:hypothetical protein